ncbi:MAG: hypothetical protein ACRYE9_02750 [Janthinobacterium lividum]
MKRNYLVLFKDYVGSHKAKKTKTSDHPVRIELIESLQHKMHNKIHTKILNPLTDEYFKTYNNVRKALGDLLYDRDPNNDKLSSLCKQVIKDCPDFDFNFKLEERNTLLMQAVKLRLYGKALLLLDVSDVNSKNKEGNSILDVLNSNIALGGSKLAKIKMVELKKLLIIKGAKESAKAVNLCKEGENSYPFGSSDCDDIDQITQENNHLTITENNYLTIKEIENYLFSPQSTDCDDIDQITQENNYLTIKEIENYLFSPQSTKSLWD